MIGEFLDAERPGEITLQPTDGPSDLLTLTSCRCHLKQMHTLIAYKQTVKYFPKDDRRQDHPTRMKTHFASAPTKLSSPAMPAR